MSEIVIKAKNLSYTYSNSKKPALKNINLEIEKGSCTLIVGKSGCGKSTLARCFNGLIPHFFRGNLKGELSVAGMNPAFSQVWEMARNIGMVFQNAESQLFTLTVEDEVAFGPENFGLPPEKIRERVNWALASIDIENLGTKSVFELSDGQQQRVIVASNLSCLPETLVFDEPTANMDPQARCRFIELLKELRNRWGRTIVLIDHRFEGLQKCVDKVVVMVEGEIRMIAPPNILSDGRRMQELGLRVAGSWRNFLSVSKSGKKQNGPPIIIANNLNFSYGDDYVIRGISFKIYPGEILGIVGANGSGKTTLLKLLTGLLKPQAGDVIVDGINTKEEQVPQLAKTFALVLQNPAHQLFMPSVYEEVTLSMGEKGISAIRTRNAEDVLRRMDLWHLRESHPHSLSEGEKQRVAIATALARCPKVLILDEPTTGMDGYHLSLLKSKLRELHSDDLTIILASHDPDLIFGLCNRAILLHAGEIIAPCNHETLSGFFDVIASEKMDDFHNINVK